MKLMKTQGASDAMQMAHYKLTIIIIIIIMFQTFLEISSQSLLHMTRIKIVALFRDPPRVISKSMGEL